MLDQVCPCGSKKNYGECCYLYIGGSALAPNPEALMRSRYTAFCVGEVSYLRQTWHPETVPDELDKEELANWIGLEIIAVDEDEDADEEVDEDDDVGEEEGEVEFKAKHIYDDKLETLHERSLFIKMGGKWLYHSGEFLNEGNNVKKIKKNEMCPCGSNKSFKNCHFAK